MNYYDEWNPVTHNWGKNIPKGVVPENPKVGDVCSPIKVEWESRYSNQAIMLLDNNDFTYINNVSKATHGDGSEFMVVAVTVEYVMLFKDGNKVVISRPFAYIVPPQDRKSGVRVEYTKDDVVAWQEMGNKFRELFAGLREPIDDSEVKALEGYRLWLTSLETTIYKYMAKTHYTETYNEALDLVSLENLEKTRQEHHDDIATLPEEEQALYADWLKMLDERPEDWAAHMVVTSEECVLPNYEHYNEEAIEQFFTDREGMTVATTTTISYNFTGHRHPGATTESPSGTGFSGTAKDAAGGDFLIKYETTWNGTEWVTTPTQQDTNDTGICYTAAGVEGIPRMTDTIQLGMYYPAVMFQTIAGDVKKLGVQAFTFSEYIPYPKGYKGQVYRNYGTTLYLAGNTPETIEPTAVQKFLGIEVKQEEQVNYVQHVNGGVATELSEAVYDLFIQTPVHTLYDIDATRFRKPVTATRAVTYNKNNSKKRLVGTTDAEYSRISYPALKKIKEWLKSNNIKFNQRASKSVIENLFDHAAKDKIFPHVQTNQLITVWRLFRVLTIYNKNLIEFINEFSKGKVSEGVINGFVLHTLHRTPTNLPTFHRAQLKGIKWEDLVLERVEDVHSFINNHPEPQEDKGFLTQDSCKAFLIRSLEPFTVEELDNAVETFKGMVEEAAYIYEDSDVKNLWDNSKLLNIDMFRLWEHHYEDIAMVGYELQAWNASSDVHKYVAKKHKDVMLEFFLQSDEQIEAEFLSARIKVGKPIVKPVLRLKDMLTYLNRQIDEYPSKEVQDMVKRNQALLIANVDSKHNEIPSEIIYEVIISASIQVFVNVEETTAIKGLARIYALGIKFLTFIDIVNIHKETLVVDISNMSDAEYEVLRRFYKYTNDSRLLNMLIRMSTEHVKKRNSQFKISELSELIKCEYGPTKALLTEFGVDSYEDEEDGTIYNLIPSNIREALTKFTLEQVLYVKEIKRAENVVKNINKLKLKVTHLTELSGNEIKQLEKAISVNIPEIKLPYKANGVHYYWGGVAYVACTEIAYKNECLSLCKVEEIITYSEHETLLLFSSGLLYLAVGKVTDFRVNEVVYT